MLFFSKIPRFAGAISHAEKALVNDRVIGQFWMKSRGQNAALLDKNRTAVALSEDFHTRTGSLDKRRANKNHFQRPIAQLCFEGDNVARELASVRVAHDSHIHQAERFLLWALDLFRQQNCAGASAQNRRALRGHFSNLFFEAGLREQFHMRGALAAGKNHAGKAAQIIGCAHVHDFRTELLQYARMCFEITLQCKNPDFHRRIYDVSLPFRVRARLPRGRMRNGPFWRRSGNCTDEIPEAGKTQETGSGAAELHFTARADSTGWRMGEFSGAARRYWGGQGAVCPNSRAARNGQ